MRTKISVFVVIGLVLSLSASAMLAQDKEEKVTLYSLLEISVKPCMIAQYEEAVKGLVALYEKYKGEYPWLGFSAADFTYYFSTPVSGLEGLVEYYKEGQEGLKQWTEEEMKNVEKSFAGTYEYGLDSIWVYRTDLSYFPEASELEEEKANYRMWFNVHVRSDKEKEYQENMKKWVALYKSKNIPWRYDVFEGAVGVKGPQYLMVFRAKDAVDFWSSNAKTWELIGEEGKELWKKTVKCIRKQETKRLWLRPDLSYSPKKEKEKEKK